MNAQEAARIMDSANNYLVRSHSTDSQAIAYSGTQAFVNLADACDILRAGRNEALNPVRRLYCTCCGGSFQGRQFHNQDIGHGMGECCADYVLNHRPFGHEPMSPAEFERAYGVRGIHFAIQSIPPQDTPTHPQTGQPIRLNEDGTAHFTCEPQTNGYDYENQAWVVDGRYVSCGHPETMQRGCYGRIHTGESPAANAEIR